MAITSEQIVIYLGPSLSAEDARQILAADYRPPVARGDIEALLRQPVLPKIVGMIDGKFFQSFAISPKEMLPLLERGVTMLGSSSMGALRAMELHPYGMIGVGRVFEMYMSGVVDADDEVAVVFDGSTGRALSLPMVNIRVALEAARKEGILTAPEEECLLQIAKREYFPSRTYPMMLRRAEKTGAVAKETLTRLARYLENGAPDAKRDDAIKLIHEVKRIAEAL